MQLIDTSFSVPLLNQCELLLCHFYPQRWDVNTPKQYQIGVPQYLLEKAVDKRLAEYVAGRHLAKTLLQKLNIGTQVERNEKTRAPIWPQGIVGSISHSKGIAACAVQRQTKIAGIGIDIEHWTPAKTAASISKEVWLPEEQHLLNHIDWSFEQALTVVFSAKEALYKALHPQVGKFFGFKAARLCLQSGDSKSGSLCFELTEHLHTAVPKGAIFKLAYFCSDDWVVTGIELEHK